MKNEFKHLTTHELVQKTKTLASDERQATLALIEALREIDRRLTFAELGYGSLFEFATKHLGLSEGSAQRRIQAMRLTRDLPEAKAQIADGTLSLSNAAKVQSFCQQEKKLGRAPQKRDIVAQVAGLSQKDCERKLFEISPEAIPRERERVVSPTERELKIIVSESLYQKIEQLRGLLAHSKPDASWAELIELMADAAIERTQKRKLGAAATRILSGESKADKLSEQYSAPSLGPIQNISSLTNLEPTAKASAKSTKTSPDQNILLHPAATTSAPLPAGRRVYLPASVRGAVWARARGQCEFAAPEQPHARCTSRYRLEIDHRVPLALNGSNQLSNLRLLCRAHNSQQSIGRGVALK